MSLNTILATAPLTATGYHLKATGTALGQSLIWDNGTNVGIGNQGTTYTLDVSGTGRFTGITSLTSATASTSTTTGGLVVTGGVGIGGALFGTSATFSSSVTASGAKPQLYVVGNASAGAGVILNTGLSGTDRRNWFIGTEENVAGDFTIKCSTAAGGNANSGDTRLAILNNGNVGIGTTSPVEALSVSGGVYINAGAGDKTNDSALYLVANSDADWGVTIDKSGYNYGLRTNVINSAGYGMALFDSTNASWSFRVAGNGYIYSTNTSVQSISSDINLKTDIKDYDKGLLEVLAMKPRYFKYKNNLNDELVGFIAQEMEEAMPGSMVENEIDKDVFAKSYIVDWHPLLVKAIQELKAEIDILKNK
jgi:hypothetical protein